VTIIEGRTAANNLRAQRLASANFEYTSRARLVAVDHLGHVRRLWCTVIDRFAGSCISIRAPCAPRLSATARVPMTAIGAVHVVGIV